MKPGRRRLLLLYGLPLFLLLLALNSILHSSSTIKEQAESAINNNNLRYLVMIDAGSSGSRVQIYSYYNSGAGSPTPPTVLNGNQTSQQWEMKVTPGISTLAQQQPSQLGEYFLPLIEFAHQTVPKSLHSHTPVYLMATAGMRLLPASQQQQTLFQTCQVFKSTSRLRVDDCEKQFQVITGESEGLYGWVALNYLVGGFAKQQQSVGFIDMGGASMQIAFQPDQQTLSRHSDDLHRIQLAGQQFPVFTTTFLGFGANEARRRFVRQLFNDQSKQQQSTTLIIKDPCLPTGYQQQEKLLDDGQQFQLMGSGEFDRCIALTLPVLNKSAPCQDDPCLFDGVHTPGVDFRSQKFVGISEFWYTSHDLFDLGGPYSYDSMTSKAREFCALDWPSIQSKYPQVNQLDRLYLQCFKTAWVITVLHDGFQVPRSQPSTASQVGTANFRTMDTVDGKPIAWTLGAALIRATEVLDTFKVSNPFDSWFMIKLVVLSVVLLIFCLGLVRLVITNSFDPSSSSSSGGVRDWLGRGNNYHQPPLLPMSRVDVHHNNNNMIKLTTR